MCVTDGVCVCGVCVIVRASHVPNNSVAISKYSLKISQISLRGCKGKC